MRLTNIKLHFNLNKAFGFSVPQLCKNLEAVISTLKPKAVRSSNKSGNYFIFNSKGCVYTVFYSGSCVNITGIKTEQEISDSVGNFVRFLVHPDVPTSETIDRCLEEVVVDNISYVGKISGSFTGSLSELRSTISGRHNNLKVYFNRDRYPGLQVKQNGHGSLSLFSTGKYLVLGVKNREDAAKLVRIIENV